MGNKKLKTYLPLKLGEDSKVRTWDELMEVYDEQIREPLEDTVARLKNTRSPDDIDVELLVRLKNLIGLDLPGDLFTETELRQLLTQTPFFYEKSGTELFKDFLGFSLGITVGITELYANKEVVDEVIGVGDGSTVRFQGKLIYDPLEGDYATTFSLSDTSETFTAVDVVSDLWSQNGNLISEDIESTDHYGTSVSVDSTATLGIVGAPLEDGIGTNRGAAYVVRRLEHRWSEVQKLIPSDPLDGDNFGSVVAMSSDRSTIAIAAKTQSTTAASAGAVYIFIRLNGIWIEQARLEPTGIAGGDKFGWGLGLSDDGNTLLATSPFAANAGTARGRAHIFTRSAGVWTQTQGLEASDKVDNDNFGYSAALSGDGLNAFCGARLASDVGAVYIFVDTGTFPTTETQKIQSSVPTADEKFGVALSSTPLVDAGEPVSTSTDGSIVAIGAPGDDGAGTDRGALYVFTNTGTWTQTIKIVDSDPEDNKEFGYATDISGDAARILVGAPFDNDGGAATDAGAVYFISNSGGPYVEDQKVRASDILTLAFFGYAVAFSTNGVYTMIGAPEYAGGTTEEGKFYAVTTNGTVSLVGDSGGTGVLNVQGGNFEVTFQVAPVNAQDIEVDYTTRAYQSLVPFGTAGTLVSDGGSWYLTNLVIADFDLSRFPQQDEFEEIFYKIAPAVLVLSNLDQSFLFIPAIIFQAIGIFPEIEVM